MNERTVQPITGRHRAKIGAHQDVSAETRRATELNMHVLGPGEPALGEWAALGLRPPDLDAIRSYRLERVRQQLVALDYAGIILYDPINIRYATDSTNMQVWVAHNPTRYVFVAADGPVIIWDYLTSEFLSGHLPLIDEIRTTTQWMYQFAGAETQRNLDRWSMELADLVKTYGRGNTRVALDRANPMAVQALMDAGLSVGNGEEVMELARVIKSADEIAAMRCAVASCQAAMTEMHEALRPGISENELWSVLHAGNIRRAGEWIETRLLSSGPRTNPWFQESSSKIIEEGELVGFDTDLIGVYGVCVDVSRTWRAGGGRPNPRQQEAWDVASDQIAANIDLLEPGRTLEELTFRSTVPDPDRYRHYSVLYHGVGLADEWPSVFFPDAWDESGFDGVIEPGMVICVESYVGPRNASEGVKLEEQVLITETGTELLSTYPLGL